MERFEAGYRKKYTRTVDFNTLTSDGYYERYISITAMPEWSDLSFEEIRMADHQVNPAQNRNKPGLFRNPAFAEVVKKAFKKDEGNDSGPPPMKTPKLTLPCEDEDVMTMLKQPPMPMDEVKKRLDEKLLAMSQANLSSVNPDASAKIAIINRFVRTYPSLRVLNAITKNGKCFAWNFTVRHVLHGEITFPGKTDVYGLDIDRCIMFDQDDHGFPSVTLFPSLSVHVPPYGEGLHRYAKVTLKYNLPKDGEEDKFDIFQAQMLVNCKEWGSTIEFDRKNRTASFEILKPHDGPSPTEADHSKPDVVVTMEMEGTKEDEADL